MPNKNGLEAINKGHSQVKLKQWHDVNLLASTGSDSRLWPNIDCTKQSILEAVNNVTFMRGTVKVNETSIVIVCNRKNLIG